MGIYRGAGGTGDAVNDSSSEAVLTVQAKNEAIAAKNAAEAAQVAAETAETNAQTAETNAEIEATNAASSAASALSSKNAAATSATNAASSASAASTSATNAASSASAASTSASSASTSASTATTQATNASNSASAAATSATNASNSASAAATSATNAANSATAASGSATSASSSASSASTSASNAATSETNAANSATTATTQAGIATTQATNAASSATAAAGSATTASTQATNAANSASAASTSATNASNSATSAASSATAAAASYDSFDDRYLGAKATAPTVDNDGNALLVGALYFNTSSNFMKVWDGSSWLDAYASLSGALLAANNLSDLTNASTARTNLGVTATGADTTYAYRANNLSDLASASTARTNLGLGTIATQAASSVAITGGAIDGTTVGATTASSGKFTSLSDSGNLAFTGTGNRITGDFSNATVANRVTFQTSTTNGNTVVGAIPNGTSTTAVFRAFNNSDPTNAGQATIGINATDMFINASATGTGTNLPMVFQTGGSERLRIDTSGNVGIGTSSPSKKLDIVANSDAIGASVRGRSSDNIGLYNFASNDGATQYGYILGSPTELRVAQNGANVITAYTNGAERMRITSTGTVGINTSAPAGDFSLTFQNASGINAGFVALTGSGGSQVSATVYSDASQGIFGTRTAHPSLFVTSGTERMRIDSSGNVGIGTSSPAFRLTVADQSNDAQMGLVAVAANRAAIMNLRGTIAGYNWLKSDTSGTLDWQIGGGAATSTLTFCTGSSGTERMRIDSSGNLLVNTTTNSVNSRAAKVSFVQNSGAADTLTLSQSSTDYFTMYSYVTSNTGTRYHIGFADGSAGATAAIGFITTNGSSVTYATTSDYRLKEDVKPMVGALDKISALKPVTYNWKSTGETSQGFIAHELSEICPQAVVGEKDAVDEKGNPVYQGIDTSFLVATLTAAIQEQQAMIEELKAKVAALEANY